MQRKLRLVRSLIFQVLFLFICGSCVAAEKVLVPASSTTFSWEEAVLVSKEKGWRGVGDMLRVSPTRSAGGIYIPYDISDAWREMDKMLPQEYVDGVAKKFGENCSSDEVSEELFDLHFYFLTFVRDVWIDKPGSRLLVFFQQYFHISSNELSSDDRGLLTGMILCGYYENKRLGHYPDLPVLTRKFGEALKNN